VRRAIAGGCALGLATGWNISNTGAVAPSLASAYDVGLAVIGLFTTALFFTHAVMQMPGGRASDRFGGRRMGLLALAWIACFSGLSMIAPLVGIAIVTRALTGFGTGLSFIAGSAYVRASGGSPAAQGLFGGFGLAGGGLALAVVPQVESWIGWRAPYATAVAVALCALLVLAAAPSDSPAEPVLHHEQPRTSIVRDRGLYRVAIVFAASLGLSITVGNWVVTMLDRHGGLGKGTAGVIGSLTLMLGVVTRPLGGWILRAHPGRVRGAVALSLVAGAAGTALLAVAKPPALAAAGAALIGVAAGIPFSPSFTGAAVSRPDAPAAAVGFVNTAGSVAILVGTPLLGLAFSLPGDGRAGFAVVAALWLVSLAALPTGRQFGAEYYEDNDRMASRMISAASAASEGEASSSGE
jgi:MFS family permease